MSQAGTYASGGGGGGTVTSVSGGTGITITGDPTINPTVNLTVPVAIANGGTNATSMTNTDGVVYYDGTRLVTTTVGTAGQVLKSNGAGVAPSFQAASGVTSLAGNTGGALTGALTLSATSATAGQTVNFGGAGSTISLNLTDGLDNTIIGRNAGGAALAGSSNVGLGAQSLDFLTTGSQNVSIGLQAGLSISTGSDNTYIGALAGSNTDGSFNIAIGDGAGENWITGTESSNIAIGSLGVNNENHTIRIGIQGTGDGQQSSCYIAGIAGVTVSNSAAVLIDTTSGQLGTVASSERYKENIQSLKPLTQELMALRPVSFNYKTDESKTTQYGLIAEEVESTFPWLVVYKDDKPETVRYHDLPVLLLAELQRQHELIKELTNTIHRLEDCLEG